MSRLGGCSFVAFRVTLGGGIATLGALAAAFGDSLGTADDHLAAHVFLVVQFGNGTLGLIDGGELNKAKSLGTMCVAVGDDLDILNGTNAAEEFEQIALGRFKGEIPNIDPGCGHLDALRLAGLTGGRTFGAGSALRLVELGRSFFAETKDRKELREEALLFDRSARGVLATGMTLVAARSAGIGGAATAAVTGTTTSAGGVAIGGIIRGHDV